MSEMQTNRFAAGAAYVDGVFKPMAEAVIPVNDFGYRRSDVTYDVVGVWEGNFFRLDDHIARFRNSMNALRLQPPESNDTIKDILHKLVRLTGLRSAYVAMDCLRGVPVPGKPRHPANARNYLVAYAVPWISIVTEEQYERGVHMIIARTLRIPPESFDPRVKNFHWGDLTAGLFEALDQGADTAVLLDTDGNVTEGPGFNVFSITDGVVATPIRGGLDGMTRQSVFELCGELGIPCVARAVPAEELRQADEIFTCTTAGGIMPVSRIDGRIMGNDRPGVISSKLKDLFWARRAEGWHATPVNYDAPVEETAGA
ncbi:aminotransferase class IV [Ancylobacter defluvii]|uniref:Probable branched-chain-amino-acid aminotransferase n=1 Tax=Ancylobacter defluvii TaxID=1282440 RepID=A0A9W6K1W8_9HYPH|nr:aminotransferase class IV [Ancylobacter defluvii]MBS7586889.1 aminotransferase class IV [Ancylobacter defluvii]GLK86195.1 branched-chain amino acid transferase [Ancylobacter defluvii]